MKAILNILLFLVCCINLNAQEVYNLVRKGNNDFKNERFIDAEVRYKKALEKDVSNPIALYNLGNAVYEQGRFEEANGIFESAALSFKEKEKQAAAYHNMGNSLMAQEKYEESVEAFKKALKLYPEDMETKYNLAYAKKMLEKQQQENESEGENEQEENQEKEQNQKDSENQEEENKDSEDEQEQEQESEENQESEEEQEKNGDNDKQENQNDEEEEKQGTQPRPETLTKEEAEQLLKALAEQEAKLQEDLNEEEVEAVQGVIQKEW
jgi:tetratricopeptide (TPR) repeat protein